MENNTQPKDPNEYYTKVLTLADLQPGDILTFEGESNDPLSALIMLLTNSKVTHGALYFQSVPVPALADAGRSGIFAHRVENKEGARSVFVSRLIKKEGLLKPDAPFAPEELKPVLEAARFYLSEGLKYPFSDLFLLALILIYKDISGSGIKQSLLIAILEALAAEIKKMIDDKYHHGEHTMVCSSFVYQCYLDASKKDKELEIKLSKDADLRPGFLGAPRSNTLFDLYVEHAAEYNYREGCFQTLKAAPTNASLDDLIAEALKAPKEKHVSLLKSIELSGAVENLLQTLMEFFKLSFHSIKDLIENAEKLKSMFVTPNDLCFNVTNAEKIGRIALDRHDANLII